jgi:hypothetical protein
MFSKGLLIRIACTTLALWPGRPVAGGQSPWNVSTTFKGGVSEVILKTGHLTQTSGTVGETSIEIRSVALIQKVTGPSGSPDAILQNLNGTIAGFNLRPATEVNQICLIVKSGDDEIRVYQNLNSFLVTALASKGRQFTSGDRDVFFLTGVGSNNVTIQYRGPKMVHPPIHPFEIMMNVSSTGELSIRDDSFREL